MISPLLFYLAAAADLIGDIARSSNRETRKLDAIVKGSSIDRVNANEGTATVCHSI
jgi:hypothetical protein